MYYYYYLCTLFFKKRGKTNSYPIAVSVFLYMEVGCINTPRGCTCTQLGPRDSIRGRSLIWILDLRPPLSVAPKFAIEQYKGTHTVQIESEPLNPANLNTPPRGVQGSMHRLFFNFNVKYLTLYKMKILLCETNAVFGNS